MVTDGTVGNHYPNLPLFLCISYVNNVATTAERKVMA